MRGLSLVKAAEVHASSVSREERGGQGWEGGFLRLVATDGAVRTASGTLAWASGHDMWLRKAAILLGHGSHIFQRQMWVMIQE